MLSSESVNGQPLESGEWHRGLSVTDPLGEPTATFLSLSALNKLSHPLEAQARLQDLGVVICRNWH